MNEREIKVALSAAGEIYGGVEEWIYTFIEGVRKRKLPLAILVILFYDGPLAKKLRDAGIQVVIPKKNKYDFLAVARIKSLLLKEKVDIVHTHGYVATIACATAAKSAHTPVVKTEHSIIEPPKDLSKIFSYARMHLNHFLDRNLTRSKCDIVTYVSRFAKECIHPSYGALPYEVIPNGITFQTVDAAFDVSFNPHHFNIGIVGRLSEVKGHRYLFEAIAMLKKAKKRIELHIFGDGALKDELRSLCGELDIHDYVSFHGFKSHIFQYIARLDLFVMPSIFESMPYALLEAMYASKPVVVSRVGGMLEVIEEGKDGLFCEVKDPKSIAEHIAYVIDNPDIAQRLAHSARQKIVAHYSIDTMIDRYLALYTKLLSQKV
jgi:glycosyltransferase involved in cell wall biosynthesis